MKFKLILMVYGFLCVQRIQADDMSIRYGESYYHLTVCCTHLTGPQARNANCCLDQESDPWGICSAVCQVERLNLRAPLRNTTLRGAVPVQDNKYQVLNLTVRSAVRYINITVEMNWVVRPAGKCVHRDLCEFSSCVKKYPDNATKCVADLVTLIQFQNNRFLHGVTEPEVTKSIAAAGARTVNFQAAVISTSNSTPVNITSSTNSSTTITSTSITSSTITTSTPTSLPFIESTSAAHVFEDFKSTEWKSVSQTSETNSTPTTTALRHHTTEMTFEDDTDDSSRNLRSAIYSVNFVVGSVCGLIGGTILTAIIIFLCWVRTGNRRSKQNSSMRCEVVPKHKIQPMANPFYSMSVPDIIGMVSDSQLTPESVYAQIGPVDTLSTQESDSTTDDVVSSSYNTLGYTSTPTATAVGFHMYNRLDRFLHNSKDTGEGCDERRSSGYDTIDREGHQIDNLGFLQEIDMDDYYHCVDTPEDRNGNQSTCSTSFPATTHPNNFVGKQPAGCALMESSIPTTKQSAVKLDTQPTVSNVSQPSSCSEEYSRVRVCRKSSQVSDRHPASQTSPTGQYAPGYANIPTHTSSNTDVVRDVSLFKHQTNAVESSGVVVCPVVHSTNIVPDSVSQSSVFRVVNPGDQDTDRCGDENNDNRSSLQNRVLYFVLEREDDYTDV